MNKLLLILLATFSFNVFAAVNLNTANKQELESINGIGPVKAQAILDYRKKNGDFKNVNEIDKVPGFGDATVQKIKGDLSVNGKTLTAPAAKPAVNEVKPAVTKDTKVKETKPAEKTVKEEKPAKVEKAADKATAVKETAAEKKARIAEEKKADKAAKAAEKAAKAAEKAKLADEAKAATKK